MSIFSELAEELGCTMQDKPNELIFKVGISTFGGFIVGVLVGLLNMLFLNGTGWTGVFGHNPFWSGLCFMVLAMSVSIAPLMTQDRREFKAKMFFRNLL